MSTATVAALVALGFGVMLARRRSLALVLLPPPSRCCSAWRR